MEKINIAKLAIDATRLDLDSAEVKQASEDIKKLLEQPIPDSIIENIKINMPDITISAEAARKINEEMQQSQKKLSEVIQSQNKQMQQSHEVAPKINEEMQQSQKYFLETIKQIQQSQKKLSQTMQNINLDMPNSEIIKKKKLQQNEQPKTQD